MDFHRSCSKLERSLVSQNRSLSWTMTKLELITRWKIIWKNRQKSSARCLQRTVHAYCNKVRCRRRRLRKRCVMQASLATLPEIKSRLSLINEATHQGSQRRSLSQRVHSAHSSGAARSQMHQIEGRKAQGAWRISCLCRVTKDQLCRVDASST